MTVEIKVRKKDSKNTRSGTNNQVLDISSLPERELGIEYLDIVEEDDITDYHTVPITIDISRNLVASYSE
jgi:hypothetical protein